MKTEQEIRERMAASANLFEIEALVWVLETPECAICGMGNRREIEVGVHKGDITPSYLEEKYSWTTGTVMTHMDSHVTFDPAEATHMEKMRAESVSTLDMAQDIVSRLLNWLDELEAQKDSGGGITSEWVADAAKLVGQANTSLKLVGQLKREIGVDSQLLLAQNQVEGIMGILVNTLADQPHILDTIELRVAALKSPSHTIDTDWEVVD
tara:strand:+ start:5097 stop:5726 length:630 start_codon:yes stop_codon:yes gene_type:complete